MLLLLLLLLRRRSGRAGAVLVRVGLVIREGVVVEEGVVGILRDDFRFLARAVVRRRVVTGIVLFGGLCDFAGGSDDEGICE